MRSKAEGAVFWVVAGGGLSTVSHVAVAVERGIASAGPVAMRVDRQVTSCRETSA